MRYKIVGWYSSDPHNEHVRPFARVVFVEASRLGSEKLDAEYAKAGQSVDLLNWYTEEVKSFGVETVKFPKEVK
jgi:hypothetical protein